MLRLERWGLDAPLPLRMLRDACLPSVAMSWQRGLTGMVGGRKDADEDISKWQTSFQ